MMKTTIICATFYTGMRCFFHAANSNNIFQNTLDSYSPRVFVSSHSRKLANAQTERSVAVTSAALVTESKLGSGYLFCYVTAELDHYNSP